MLGPVATRGSSTTAGGTVTVTRRALIGLGGGVALSLTGAGIASAAMRSGLGLSRRIWSRSTYGSLVGSSFAVGGLATRLRLIEITDLPHRPTGSDEAFGLVFSGPSDEAFPVELPALSHPALGRFSMLLSPGPRSGSSRRYFAVIDRTV
jgi:hypothetical protein